MTKTNFQHSDLAQIFMKIFFYFLKNIGQLISTASLLEVPESLNPSLLQQAWIQAWDLWGKLHFLGLKSLISSLSIPQMTQEQD